MRYMSDTSTLLTVLLLTTLTSHVVTRSAHTRKKRSDEIKCPTLCVIDQTQGRFLRRVEGTYLPELYLEKCETPCNQECYVSQDPQVPQIVAHICAPESELCDFKQDASCRRHVVVGMDHRIDFSVGVHATDGPLSTLGSTTLYTEFNFPTGLVRDLGTTTSWTMSSSATTVSHVNFDATDPPEEYVTATQRPTEDCSAFSHRCPIRGEFCFGLVSKVGVSYGCYPDKPVCSTFEGCVRVCLPSVESCDKTVSPSSSWGTVTHTPDPTKEPKVDEEDTDEEVNLTPEEGHPDKEDKEDSNDEDNTTSEETDLKNDSEYDVDDPSINETEKDTDSATVGVTYSVLIYLALVLRATMG